MDGGRRAAASAPPNARVDPCDVRENHGGCTQLVTMLQNQRDFLRGVIKDEIVPLPAELPTTRLYARETHEVRHRGGIQGGGGGGRGSVPG